MKTIRQTLCALIARHVGCPVEGIHAWQHLERDLDVTPLELVLVTLELEEAEGVDLAGVDLADIETVGQLIGLLQPVVVRQRRARVLGRTG